VHHLLVRLGDVAKVRRVIVPEVDIADGKVTMVERISFDGEIFVGKENTKMEQFLAQPGDLIVSKIRARQGSVGLVAPSLGSVSVTIHYRALTPDMEKINEQYAWLVLRSSYARAQFLAATGGAMKGEISEEVLLDIRIPLPPLETQRAIVARWQQAQAEIAAANEQVKKLETRVLAEVRKAMGREQAARTERPMVFALNFKDLDRWGADVCWKTKTKTHTANYPTVEVADLCKISSGGTPSRQVAEYFGGDIPWVKTTEVRDEVIYETEETLTQLGLENSSAKIYPRGSLIVAMYGQGATRGRTAKLGIDAATNQACAVLTRFSEQVEPDFLWFYLMSEYDDLRDLASGNNQPNLNAEMIATYSIPLPPLEVQRDLVRRVEESRAEVTRLRAQAARHAQEAQAEVEAAILGSEDLPGF